MLRLLLAAVFAIGLGFFSFRLVQRSEARSVIDSVCHSVVENYFDKTQNLSQWLDQCRGSSRRIKRCSRQDGHCVSSVLNQAFTSLESSHLFISTPASSRRYYYHETQSNGLKVRWIEGHFVVVGVYPGSPAEQSEIQFGDVLLKKDGRPLRSVSEALGAGLFKVSRKERRFEMHLESSSFQMNHLPLVQPLTSSVALLTVPSFEGHYDGVDLFAQERVQNIFESLKPFKGVVIDLRGNLGGNFVALLRALSFFLCEAQSLGRLQKVGETPGTVMEFPDSLEVQDQLRVIEQAEGVELKTFSGYGCYEGKAALLVDSQTSSVAEIFAHQMHEKLGSQVLGQLTAGAVLVGLREELLELGRDFVLNMPILTYMDEQGRVLEGQGVLPQQELIYSLESFRNQKDNWVEAALERLSL